MCKQYGNRWSSLFTDNFEYISLSKPFLNFTFPSKKENFTHTKPYESSHTVQNKNLCILKYSCMRRE